MLIHRILFFVAALLLCSCGRPFLYPNDATTADGKPAKESAEQSKARLEIPPDLRGEIEVPPPSGPGEAAETSAASAGDEAVVGDAVSLDARLYSVNSSKVFSAVVDALTALNKPVESVDSGSGTITTDWVRSDVDNPSSIMTGGLFGGGAAYTRYRYVVRVFSQGEGTRLEIRTLGQAFLNRHWVNKPLKRDVAEELFVATEEQMAR